MKKTVALDKSLEFPTMIGEISSISLEENIKFINEDNIEGELFLNGKYKLTEASRLEEDFSYKIPVEIALSEKLDINKSNVLVTDFFYEIEEDNMICHIELTIEGEPLLEERDEEETSIKDSIFTNLNEDNETYGTFIVYIVRQNESINTIVEKYHTTIEEIEKYNDIKNIDIGTKLIIPITNE